MWYSQHHACAQNKQGWKEKTTTWFLPLHMKILFPKETIRGENLCWLGKQIMFRNIIILNCDLRQQQKPPQPHFWEVWRLKLRQLEYNNTSPNNNVTNGGWESYHHGFIRQSIHVLTGTRSLYIRERRSNGWYLLEVKEGGISFSAGIILQKLKGWSHVKQFAGAAHKLQPRHWVSLLSVRWGNDWNV